MYKTLPAAAVIPAAAAYIYIAAFKKLVVAASDAGGGIKLWELVVGQDNWHPRSVSGFRLKRDQAGWILFPALKFVFFYILQIRPGLPILYFVHMFSDHFIGSF